MILGIVASSANAGGGATPPPSVGSFWPSEGGYYAGVVTYGDGRSFHLVLAEKVYRSSSVLQWRTTATATAGTYSIDDGVANTAAMIAVGAALHPAAQLSVSAAGGGYSDWYLPAENELIIISNVFNSAQASPPTEFEVGGAQELPSNLHWSSTTVSTDPGRARGVAMLDSEVIGGYRKNFDPLRVAPVRRVAI